MGWSLLLPRNVDARAVLAELRGRDRTVSQPAPGVLAFGDGYRLRGPLPVGPLDHPLAWLSRRWAVWYRDESDHGDESREFGLRVVLTGLAIRLGGRARCGFPLRPTGMGSAYLPGTLRAEHARALLTPVVPDVVLSVAADRPDRVSYELAGSGFVVMVRAPEDPPDRVTGVQRPGRPCTGCLVPPSDPDVAGPVSQAYDALLTLAEATGGVALDEFGFPLTRAAAARYATFCGDDVPARAYPGLDLTLRPPVLVRFAMAFSVGGSPAVAGVTGIGSIPVWWCAGLVAIGVAIAVRAARLGIRGRGGVLTVRGLFTTRRVPANRVTDVIMTYDGRWIIRYRNRFGWRWRLRPTGFWTSRVPGILRRNQASIGRLRRWLQVNGAPWIGGPPVLSVPR